jgi:hypothetical protein
MAIKKAICGRQPDYLSFGFSLHTLDVARHFYFILPSVVFNEVPSFTHLDFINLINIWSRKFIHNTIYEKNI